MKAIVDKISAKSYDFETKKYIAWCRIKYDDGWEYKQIPFDTMEEWDNLKVGDFVDIKTIKSEWDTFSVGDNVRVCDGDGRIHTIKEFQRVGVRSYEVIFEDGSAKGFIKESGYTDMVKF